MKRVLILGGGFAGTTIANLLASEGWETTLFEKEQVLGGGCRTYFQGGHPYTLGPRLYYGYSDKIFKYVDGILKIRRFPFELLTYVEQDARFYTYPIHEADIPKMREREKILAELAARDNSKEPADFEEYWINRVGPTLYNMFVNNYSKKMWMVSSNKVFDIFKWSAKDKPIETGTKEAYKGSYIGYPVPADGYNSYFDKMVVNTKVHYGNHITRVNFDKPSIITAEGTELKADLIVSSMPIDELCQYSLGELPYAGRDFHVFTLPCKQIFPGDVRFCHYAQSESFTRVTEFKKITYHESEDTLLVGEVPSKSNKLYPYLTKANVAKATDYMKQLPDTVYSIGRLGTYKYSTIEQTIAQAFAAFTNITGKSIDGMEKEFFSIGDVSLIKGRAAETAQTKGEK